MTLPIDPILLAQDLIRCPSVTPAEGGALDLLQRVLEGLGFVCRRMPFEEIGADRVDNLYARLGSTGPNLCFAGHTDVVPPGDNGAWRTGPFDGEIRKGWLIGRGAVDMKGAIASWVAAVSAFKAQHLPFGSISLLITGDEEGPAVNGTRKMLEALAAEGERIDACITGEPTNPHALGEMMKIGRRGSLNGWLTVHGTQGHTGYPHLADNAAHRIITMLKALTDWEIDQGSAHFQPSTLAVSTIDINNPANNVIPGRASAHFNVRFNDLHSGHSLEERIRAMLARAAGPDGRWELVVKVSGESFLTPPGALSTLLAEACEAVTGRRPEFSTTGGTSDSRFIKDYCPVVDFGLVGDTMHQIDERVRVEDLTALADIYLRVIRGFFADHAG